MQMAMMTLTPQVASQARSRDGFRCGNPLRTGGSMYIDAKRGAPKTGTAERRPQHRLVNAFIANDNRSSLPLPLKATN